MNNKALQSPIVLTMLFGLIVGLGVFVFARGSARPPLSDSHRRSQAHPSPSVPGGVSPAPNADSRHVDRASDVAVTADSIRQDLTAQGEASLRYEQFRRECLERKRRGDDPWGGATWFKDSAYYHKLDTEALAIECLERPILPFELLVYDDPMLGYIRAKTLHPGLAELLDRPDLWRGMLAVYEAQGKRLVRSASMLEISKISITVHGLGRLYAIPEFYKHLKGHEKEYFESQLKLIGQFRAYLGTFDRPTINDVPFFCEPVTVVNTALLFAESIDKARFEAIKIRFTSVGWPKEQKIEDVARFLDMAESELSQFLPKR